MARVQEIRYGIEITKPFSKEMYDHNDRVSIEMKSNIKGAIEEAFRRAAGLIAADGGMEKGEEDLQEISRAICGYGFGDGYELADIVTETLYDLDNIANWSIHQEYGWLYKNGFVPEIEKGMVGFTAFDIYFSTDGYNN